MYGSVFLDPIAPLLVVGGAGAVAAMRSTRQDCARAIAALGPMIRTQAEADARAARVAVNRIREKATTTGIATADRAAVVERFMARCARELADATTPAVFKDWADEEIALREDRHAAVHAVWRAAADAAPAMGMIGTVVGLIRMFAAMDDPSAIGPGMALALTTTLYGIIIANVIAGPIAARLERLSRAEIDWQGRAVAKLTEIAQAELAEPIGDRAARSEARLKVVA